MRNMASRIYAIAGRSATLAVAVALSGCGSSPPPRSAVPPTVALRGANGEILGTLARPQPVSQKAPTYTKEACEAKVEGTAIARCIITEEGALRSCHLLKGLPHLDEAILAALREWKYVPAVMNGKPVAVSYVLTIHIEPPPCFERSKGAEARARARSSAPPVEWNSDMTRPTLLEGKPPTYSPEAMAQKAEGPVRANCIVTEEGRLEQCLIAEGSPLIASAVLAVLPEWRFTPATLNGRPVRVIYTIPIRVVPPSEPRPTEPTRSPGPPPAERSQPTPASSPG